MTLFPNMCGDGHVPIGHGEDDCPLCRVLKALKVSRAYLAHSSSAHLLAQIDAVIAAAEGRSK